MPELTPEERRRIYEEEKARIEAREAIEAQRQADAADAAHLAESQSYRKRNNPVVTGLLVCALLFVAYVGSAALSEISKMAAQAPAPSSGNPSSAALPPSEPDVSSEQREVLQAQIKAMEKRKADTDKVTVPKGWEWTTDGDYDYVKGSVKNGSGRTVRYWKVTAHFFDKRHQIIDTAFTNALETLPPGASKRFEIMHSTAPHAVKARAFVEEVQFDDD